MAKKKRGGESNLFLLSIVGIVAIVGIVVLVMSATGTTSPAPTEEFIVIEDDLVGDAIVSTKGLSKMDLDCIERAKLHKNSRAYIAKNCWGVGLLAEAATISRPAQTLEAGWGNCFHECCGLMGCSPAEMEVCARKCARQG